MEFTLNKFKPMNNRVLIKKYESYDPAEYTTKSGIIVINREKPVDRYAMAIIIKLGQRMLMPDGSYKKLTDIWSEGDKVFYYVPAQGVPLKLDGENYFLIRAEDILQAVIEDDNNDN